jgi:hypothetical protein
MLWRASISHASLDTSRPMSSACLYRMVRLDQGSIFSPTADFSAGGRA